MKTAAALHPFYKANIHERRFAAYICRIFPVVFAVTILTLIFWACQNDSKVLVVLSSIFNVIMWLWLMSYAVMCLLGVREARKRVRAPFTPSKAIPRGPDAPVHLIILPNYKEDEKMLEQTLQSLTEAQGSEAFRVVLAMEQREGADAAEKGRRLREQFAGKFEWVQCSVHPSDELQDHLDGSSDPEVPGKASNLKWAFAEGLAWCKAEGLRISNVLLTVADADCLFHSAYFSSVAEEFEDLRSDAEDSEVPYTMWQAPQLPFRNYFDSPCCSRCWGYIATVFEFGGVSGLKWGSHHMIFSAYTLPLALARDVQPWDGDVIAEDHHAYLKSLFYALHASALQGLAPEPPKAPIRGLDVRPVLLPVKSTSVASPGNYWRSYAERWDQAKRHSQGVAEFSYALLATWDAVRTLPIRLWNCRVVIRILRALFHLWCVHLLPFCQSVCWAMFTIYWFIHKEEVPGCPSKIWMLHYDTQFFLCGTAGAYVLFWPVLVPFSLIFLSNACILNSFFLSLGGEGKKRTVWQREDGATRGSSWRGPLFMYLMNLFDLILLFPPLMIPYGLCANVYAFFNVALCGNRFTYVTASKGTTTQSPMRNGLSNSGTYGSTDGSANPIPAQSA